MSDEGDRRDHVLEVALGTFARFGYRKTSMDDIARAADISRPGLYFLFTSKPNLFRAAAIHALDRDLAAAERVLADTGRPLADRLIEAFDAWTGRYIGPMAREVTTLVDTHPDLLGDLTADYPARFLALVTSAIATQRPGRSARADDLARTLRSTAIGIKQEAATREEFLARVAIAVDLLIPPARRPA
ncbi:TetR/AcrR family transcriptional regulator [Dactylosporangium sp. CS-033363]|uniref:TetR/AcrR family transcriptional regulator n=1 Tax=Dactylosporangium sp. CS-033363 TaxID=3239935 RepID=UPI003D8A6BC9